MKVEYENCAGLDVHKSTVVACVLKGTQGKQPATETKSFGTTTPELIELVEWFKSHATALPNAFRTSASKSNYRRSPLLSNRIFRLSVDTR